MCSSNSGPSGHGFTRGTVSSTCESSRAAESACQRSPFSQQQPWDRKHVIFESASLPAGQGGLGCLGSPLTGGPHAWWVNVAKWTLAERLQFKGRCTGHLGLKDGGDCSLCAVWNSHFRGEMDGKIGGVGHWESFLKKMTFELRKTKFGESRYGRQLRAF